MNQGMEISIAPHIITSSDPHGGNVYFPIQQLYALRLEGVMLLLGNIVKVPCNFKVWLSSSYYGLPIERDQQESVNDPEY